MLVGCDSPTVGPDASGEAPQTRLDQTFAAGGDKAASAVSKARVVTFADPAGPAVGTSVPSRSPDGVSFRLNTSGLGPGHAATLWAVIFNNPEQCTPPECGEDDLFNADARPDVVYEDGSIADAYGYASFAGRRRAGDGGGSVWEILGLPAFGLIDAEKAEIHLIVRDHGPVIPGMEEEMTHTFNGGCRPVDLPDDPRLGAPGPNTCEDVQFAAHQP